MAGILSIGKSALNAAQMGLSVTGHNIANANTAGYSRQVIGQAAAPAQSFGSSFIGQGVDVSSVSRIYSEILTSQAVNSQSISTSANTYKTQINAISNMLSDASAGLNPALNRFFGGVQDLAANPSDIPTRQSMLSNAQTLVNRFQSTSNRLNEIRHDVNTQLNADVGLVNTYAKQIAGLNDTIEKTVSAGAGQPNDLLDQRDQLVLDLSKLIKTTVVPQGQGSYNIYIGNGLPLVVGSTTMRLATIPSPTDPSRLEVAYQSNGASTVLGMNSLPGGSIGGLLEFRANSLDPAQNQVGQMAVALASDFNAQHIQGIDLNGNAGGNLFNIPSPAVYPSTNNTGSATATSSIVDAHALTSSDYRLQYDGTNYKITRLNDNVVLYNNAALPVPASLPTPPATSLDGLSFNVSVGMLAGDEFVIRPTQNASTTISLAISDAKKLAIGSATPSSIAKLTNTGSGSISAPTAGSTLTSPLDLTYTTGAPGTFTLAPSTQPVTVTVAGVPTIFPPGTPITYTSGANIAVGGLNFSITGAPANGDKFSISPSGAGDNRNGLLLAGLQSQTTMNNGTTSYSSAFGQLVNSIGNKSHELQITSAAEAQILQQNTDAVQSLSGVNLDEEAANLILYQQAYQAAGKMMQIASQLFDSLLQIG
ncbi:MAG: flagellar hook-associated protein FlgK [Methylotenera sp.]|nr:flagellar hook-associated protein FlgK [Methylotenera sp.]